MISVSSEEVDLYLEKIEEVIGILSRIDYSVDPYHFSQNIEKTPQHSVGYSKAELSKLHHVLQELKKYNKD
tara:strand:- start:2159 stop:2371 length:213 start_codon:yes stop_codon:yes gene_type:complete